MEESVEYFYLAVFKGTYRHRIDPKGRLPVPAAFRRQLRRQGASGGRGHAPRPVPRRLPAGRVGAARGAARGRMPAFSRPVKALTRLLASRAQRLRARRAGPHPPAADAAPGGASSAGEVLVVGVLDRFEIWTPETLGHLRSGVGGPARRRVASTSSGPCPRPRRPPAPSADPPRPRSGTGGNPQAKPKR